MTNVFAVSWVSETGASLIPGKVRLLDQTRLPREVVFEETADPEAVWQAIKQLKVRGAPAIGVAAAMGLAAGLQGRPYASGAEVVAEARRLAGYLGSSRPTAVNLFAMLERMVRVAGAEAARPPDALLERLAREAAAIRDEDEAQCRAIGEHGLPLIARARAVLTHCNAGALATAAWGTALAPVYLAHQRGQRLRVYADETRPLLQGARLTAWELQQAGVDVTLICDNMAAQVMKEGKVDAVLVGADRIAANGDTANKIGTYGVALLARAHRLPFYVLAPTTTFDLSLSSGEQIPIEQRDPAEITRGFGRPTAPEGVDVYAPAFDVTPAELITGIVCEHGVAEPPYLASLARLAGKGAR